MVDAPDGQRSGAPGDDAGGPAGRGPAGRGPAGRGPARSRAEFYAGGGALLPGLHDHHIHLLALAAARRSVAVGPGDVVGREGFAAALREADAALQAGRWVRAVGYHESVAGPLDREVLDAIVPGRPVRVQHRGGAMWVVNSAALDLLGVDEGGPAAGGAAASGGGRGDGAPAGVETAGDGRATGRLYGVDAWLGERVPREPLDLGGVGRMLLGYGVTGVTDATPTERVEDLAALAAAVADGALPQHIVVTGGPGLDQAGLGRGAGLEWGPVKLVVGDHALPDLDGLVAAIDGAHRSKRNVAVHCVTRVGLLLALAAWDEAGARAGDRIEHGAVVHPEEAVRIAAHRLTVVTQPAFVAERGDDYLADVDPDDRAHLWPCAGLLQAGIAVGGSTDAPFGPADPWQAIAAAVDRRTPSGAILGAGERLDARRALDLFLGPPGSPGGPIRRVAAGAPADLCLLAAAARGSSPGAVGRPGRGDGPRRSPHDGAVGLTMSGSPSASSTPDGMTETPADLTETPFLDRLRLDGAIFLRAEYTEPWAYVSLDGPTTAGVLRPGTDRVTLFHVVAGGQCWVALADGERHWAAAGDVIVLPYGDQHHMGGTEPADVVSITSFLKLPPWDEFPVLSHGAGGPRTDVVCGYLHSDDPLFDPALQALPPLFVVHPDDAAARWVASSIDYAMRDPGATLSARLPELLLAEVLRIHLASAPAVDRGWLAALRDPVLAPALAQLHAAPERKWTVAELAATVAVSRSQLDARFRQLLRAVADPLPRRLAHAQRRGAAGHHRTERLRRGPAGRLRLGGGLQPGLQAGPGQGPVCLANAMYTAGDGWVASRAVMNESVLLVEDDASVAEATGLLLQRAGLRVTGASDGRRALDLFDGQPFDAVVLDVMLPAVDGFEVCRSIRRVSNVPIVMLTARTETAEIVAGLELGADDYVTKPFDGPELVARLRAALRRATTDEPVPTIRIGTLEIDGAAFRASDRGRTLDLSATEFRLLLELARHPDRVLSRETLLERVWGYDYLGDSRLVDMAVNRLRTKLGDDPKDPRYISTLRGVGYRFTRV